MLQELDWLEEVEIQVHPEIFKNIKKIDFNEEILRRHRCFYLHSFVAKLKTNQ